VIGSLGGRRAVAIAEEALLPPLLASLVEAKAALDQLTKHDFLLLDCPDHLLLADHRPPAPAVVPKAPAAPAAASVTSKVFFFSHQLPRMPLCSIPRSTT
jgi:hypothetical protein